MGIYRYFLCLLLSTVSVGAGWSTNYWPATNHWWIRAGHIEELHGAINERTLAATSTAWGNLATNVQWIDRDYIEDAWDQLDTITGYYVNTNKLGTGTTFNAYFATNETWIAWTWTGLVEYVTGTNVIHGMNSVGQVDSWYVRRDTLDDLRNCIDQLTHGWWTVSWGTSTNFVKIQYNDPSPFTSITYTGIQAISYSHYTGAPPTWLNRTFDPDSTVSSDNYWSDWGVGGKPIPGTDEHGVIGQGVSLNRTAAPLYSEPYMFNGYGTPAITGFLSDDYKCAADLYLWAGTNFVTGSRPNFDEGIPVDLYDSGTNTWPTTFTFTQTVTKAVATTNINWTGPYGDTSHAPPTNLWPASSNTFPIGFGDYGVGWNMRGMAILRWDSDASDGFKYLP